MSFYSSLGDTNRREDAEAVPGEKIEAILLVGGRGTRLRPLTLATPKPMLPTAGVPFVAHQLARLRDAGVTRVVLATSYREEVFRDYLAGEAPSGLDVVCVAEKEPLGTGGGVRHAADYLESGPGDPVLVINGDVLSGHELERQVAAHHRTDAAVTLHLTEVADAGSFGCVPTAPDGRVLSFEEKSAVPVTNWINAGCYVFSGETLRRIPGGMPVSLERETFPELLKDGALLFGHADSAYWLDVGTPAAYVQASADLVTGRLVSPAVPESTMSGPAGPALLARSADVAADGAVGGGAALGERARVESGAGVSGSVVFDDVVVCAGALVRDSVLASGARIGGDTVLDGAVIGPGVTIGEGNELREGARIWPHVRIPDGAIRFSADV